MYEQPGSEPVFSAHCNGVQFMQSIILENVPTGDHVVHIGYGDQDIDALIASVPLDRIIQFIDSAGEKR